MNENYHHPEMPKNINEDIIKGIYKYSENKAKGPKVQLMGSGVILREVIEAANILEKDFNVDLMNKMNTAFKVGENINIISLANFQNFVKVGKISEETIVFNNMIQSKVDFDSNWEVSASQSWHKRFFGTVIS